MHCCSRGSEFSIYIRQLTTTNTSSFKGMDILFWPPQALDTHTRTCTHTETHTHILFQKYSLFKSTIETLLEMLAPQTHGWAFMLTSLRQNPFQQLSNEGGHSGLTLKLCHKTGVFTWKKKFTFDHRFLTYQSASPCCRGHGKCLLSLNSLSTPYFQKRVLLSRVVKNRYEMGVQVLNRKTK